MTDGSGGYLLALLTDSFVVRASIGTLAAVLLSLLTIRLAPIKSPLGRRILVLAPVITAAVAAVASLGGQFLPTLLVMSSAQNGSSGNVLDVLGESRQITQARSIGVLLMLYALIAAALLSRRVAGAVRVRVLLRRARQPDGYDRTVRMLQRLSATVDVRCPQLRLIENCPGGAFSAGRWRPVVALDPGLLALLDDGELEGLLAHELAHLRRADPLTGLVVGMLGDLAFFLPGIHIAAHWLDMEQEESADELAASVTCRPAALASGLLKVWQWRSDAPQDSRMPAGACAAGGHPTALMRWTPARLVPAGLAPWPAPDGFTVITRRVKRLIEALPTISDRRRQVEMGIGVGVTLIAVVASLAAPAWLSRRHTDLFGFFYMTNPPSATAESPAFTTFRALVSDGPAARGSGAVAGPGDVVAGHDSRLAASPSTADAEPAAAPDGDKVAACPCVASPSQLASRQSASPDERPGPTWGSRAWTLRHLQHQADLQATRRLLLMDSSDQQLGFLTAGHSASELMPSIPAE